MRSIAIITGLLGWQIMCHRGSDNALKKTTTNHPNLRGMCSTWEINESLWILGAFLFCFPLVCFRCNFAEWYLSILSEKKSVQIIVKVEFFTQACSCGLLEFFFAFFSCESEPIWKIGNLTVEFFNSLECKCMKTHTLDWEVFFITCLWGQRLNAELLTMVFKY